MKWAGALAIFIAGTTFGLVGSKIFSLKFKPEFDIANILTLVVTLIIALLIQHSAYWKHRVIRTENKLLIKQAQKVLRVVEGIRAIALQSYQRDKIEDGDSKQILSLCRDLFNGVLALEKSMELCGLRKGYPMLGKVQDKMYEYKRALTGGTDFDTKHYTFGTYNRQEYVYKHLCEDLMMLTLEINRRA